MVAHALLFLLCILSVLGAWWYRRPPRSAPGPRGFPLFGVLLKMAMRPHVVLYEWSKEYGPVMSVRVGREDWVVLSEVKAMKEALVKQGRKFDGRPANYFTNVVLSGNKQGILFTDGEVWRKQKHFGVAAFRKLGIGKKDFENIITDEASCLVNSLSSTEGRPCDCKRALTNATTNVMYAVLHGRRLKYGDEKFTKLSKFLQLFSLDPKRARTVNAVIFFPALRFLPPFRSEITTGLKIRAITEQYLRSEVRNSSGERKIGDPARGFVDAFKDEGSQNGNAGMFDEAHLLYYMRDLLLGGIETTTVSLLWCVMAAALHGEWQKKIQIEIDRVIAEREASFDNQQDMPCTMAFIQEVHRFCTVVPLALPHLAVEDARLGDYLVCKGTTVILNLWAAHRDPRIFEDPHEFRPQRFVDSDGQFVKSENVMPFATGARACMGQQLARTEMFIFFVSILRRFDISMAASDKLPTLSDGILSTTNTPNPFKVLFIKRMLSESDT